MSGMMSTPLLVIPAELAGMPADALQVRCVSGQACTPPRVPLSGHMHEINYAQQQPLGKLGAVRQHCMCFPCGVTRAWGGHAFAACCRARALHMAPFSPLLPRARNTAAGIRRCVARRCGHVQANRTSPSTSSSRGKNGCGGANTCAGQTPLPRHQHAHGDTPP